MNVARHSYRVGQKSKPQACVHIFAKYWPILKLFFTGTFRGKFVIRVVTKYTTTTFFYPRSYFYI